MPVRKVLFGFDDDHLVWGWPRSAGGDNRLAASSPPLTRGSLTGLKHVLHENEWHCGDADAVGPNSDECLHALSRTVELLVDRRLRKLLAQSAELCPKDQQLLTVMLPALRELHDVPLEAAPWLEADRPACGSDHFLLARHGTDPTIRRVIPTDAVRALVIFNHRRHEARVNGEPWAERLKRLPTATAEQLDVTFLHQPTWERVKDALDDRDYNVVLFVGHVEVGPGADRPHYLPFGAPSPSDAAAEPDLRTPLEFADLIAAQRTVRCVGLIGCHTWSLFARALIDKAVPAVLGTHWRFELDDRWLVGVEQFLVELATTGRLDAGFLALRRSISDPAADKPAAHLSAWLAMHVFGDNLQLVTEDEELRLKIRYARAVHEMFSHVELPTGRVDDPAYLRRRHYISRQVNYREVDKDRPGEPRKAGARDDAGPSEREVRRQQKEEELFRQLWSAAATLGLKAPAGVGKTGLMQNLTYRMAAAFLEDPESAAARLPLYVRLRALAESLNDLLRVTLRGQAEPDRDRAGRLMEVLQLKPENVSDWPIVLVLDGLDEAKGADQGLVSDFANLLSGKSLLKQVRASIVSSRPEAVQRLSLPHFNEGRGREHIFELEPWTLSESRQYISQYFNSKNRSPSRGEELAKLLIGEQDGMDPSRMTMRALAGQPFLLWLWCSIAEKRQSIDDLPDRETSLLAEAVANIIRIRNSDRDRATGEDDLKDDHLDLLGALAFEVSLRRLCPAAPRDPLGFEEACDVLRELLNSDERLRKRLTRSGASAVGVDPEEIAAICKRLLDRSGMVAGGRGHGPDAVPVQFNDERFLEFFTAWHLNWMVNHSGWDEKPCIPNPDGAKRGTLETVRTFLTRKAWDEANWGRPIVHLAALMNDPTPLLRELIS